MRLDVPSQRSPLYLANPRCGYASLSLDQASYGACDSYSNDSPQSLTNDACGEPIVHPTDIFRGIGGTTRYRAFPVLVDRSPIPLSYAGRLFADAFHGRKDKTSFHFENKVSPVVRCTHVRSHEPCHRTRTVCHRTLGLLRASF